MHTNHRSGDHHFHHTMVIGYLPPRHQALLLRKQHNSSDYMRSLKSNSIHRTKHSLPGQDISLVMEPIKDIWVLKRIEMHHVNLDQLTLKFNMAYGSV